MAWGQRQMVRDALPQMRKRESRNGRCHGSMLLVRMASREGEEVTARGTWKAAERRYAADHGTTRIPVNGRHGPDFESATVCGQVKLRKSVPACVRKWTEEIASHAEPNGKIGILIMRKPGEGHEDAPVTLRYRDWQRIVRDFLAVESPARAAEEGFRQFCERNWHTCAFPLPMQTTLREQARPCAKSLKR